MSGSRAKTESGSGAAKPVSGFRLSPSVAFFLAFTALFAGLAGFVFWGTWSLNVVPVMPDDSMVVAAGYSDVWHEFWNLFLREGKLIPSDLWWRGFLISPLFCRELKYTLALYFAGLGLAYFLRGRGLSRAAAYGGGLFLAFCGYWASLFSAGHSGWFEWMTYGVFAFGLIDRALTGNRLRHWLLLGAVLAWGSFYQPDLWLLFTLFTAAYFVFRWLSVIRSLRSRPDGSASGLRPPATVFPWRGMLLALAAFALIGAPSFYHAVTADLAGRDKQIAESQGKPAAGKSAADGKEKSAAAAADRERRWEFVTNWSLPPDETAEFFCARLNGDTSCPLTLSMGGRLTGVRPYTGALGRPLGAARGNYRQHSLYVGWVTCVFALVALVAAVWRRRNSVEFATVLLFAIAAVLFYLLSLGRYCEPVYRLVFALPLGDYLRAPVKWHHLTEFCLVVLAAFGIESLWRLAGDSRLWKGALVAAIVYGAIDLARVDRLYCAPEPANYQVQLADARQIQSAQTREYLYKNGIAILGDANGIAALGRYRRPQPHTGALPAPQAGMWLGVVSVLTSFAVAVVALRRMDK